MQLDRNFKRIIFISAIVLIACGWNRLFTLWKSVAEVFTVFADIAMQRVEHRFSLPYVITGIIMLILSYFFGIHAGKNGGKLIYRIIAIVTSLLGLVSIPLALYP